MNLELTEILERLKIATNTSSARAMCQSLGLMENSVGNWKRQETIPYRACFLAAQKSGYSMEWILTGSGQKMLNDSIDGVKNEELDQDKLSNDFAEIIADGVELGFLAPTEETTAETLDILGRKLYRRYTGNLRTIPGIKSNKTG